MSSWKIEEPPDIRKIFKKLGSNEKIQYISAIKTLATSEDPKIHGQYKQTKGCYSYRLLVLLEYYMILIIKKKE